MTQFQVEVNCEGENKVVMTFQMSSQPGGIPFLTGVNTDFGECEVKVTPIMKVEASNQGVKRKHISSEVEKRSLKRSIFYDTEAEDDSSEEESEESSEVEWMEPTRDMLKHHLK